MSVVTYAEPLATLDTDDCTVNIVGYTTTESEGKNIFVALLEYTNKESESNAPWSEVVANAYQNGIQLESTWVYKYTFEDYKDADVKVRPGSTLKFYKMFEMTDDSPVDVEVSPIFNLDRVHAEYTFDISDNGSMYNASEDTSGDVDWEEKYNKLKKKYDKLKKKYKKLKAEIKAA